MQILSGLQAVHSGELVHRGLTTHFIGLANRSEAQGQGPVQSKVVKVGKAAYYMRLLDLHRSNPFGNDISSVIGYFNLPQEWYVLSSIFHTFALSPGHAVCNFIDWWCPCTNVFWRVGLERMRWILHWSTHGVAICTVSESSCCRCFLAWTSCIGIQMRRVL